MTAVSSEKAEKVVNPPRTPVVERGASVVEAPLKANQAASNPIAIRADDVDGQRSQGKPDEQPHARDVHAVAQGRTDAATGEHDQIPCIAMALPLSAPC